ncbi:hypothetical protein [Tunturiibacter empetritectus]|uniref:hypothetical protein n=1 Tax=Tunturiibacter empetritectus TaxID=3069691 RepID=UPI003D9BBC59
MAASSPATNAPTATSTPQSSASPAPRMLQLLKAAGFTDATWTSYTFGVVGLYHATKP